MIQITYKHTDNPIENITAECEVAKNDVINISPVGEYITIETEQDDQAFEICLKPENAITLFEAALKLAKQAAEGNKQENKRR